MKTFKPPRPVALEAQRGLVLWNESNRKCATPVGVKRAHQLSRQDEVSLATVKRMWSFFKRHKANRKNALPKCGEVSWLLWGGDSGMRWVNGIMEKLK